MQSIGVVFKKDEMVLVALKQGIADYQLDGYRILPFFDLREEEREQAILHNIDRFVQAYKGGRDNMFIALPRDMALVQFVQMPAAAEENLGATLGFEIDRYTPFGFDDVYFDWHVTNRLADSGQITVMLVTVKRTIIDYYLGLFEKLELRPQAIEISTTALCNAFMKRQGALERLQDAGLLRESGLVSERMIAHIEKAFPRAAGFLRSARQQEQDDGGIDILVEYLGAATCELAVFVKNTLWHSQSVTLSSPAEAGAEHLQELFDAGSRSLIYLPAVEQDRPQPLRFRLSGRELPRDAQDAAPEALDGVFSVSRQLPVTCEKFTDDTFTGSLPVLFLPAAVAVRGLRATPCDINLIPATRRPRRKKSKRKLVAAAALLVLVAGLSSFTATRNAAMQERLDTLREEVTGLRRQVEKIEARQQEAERQEKFIKAMQAIRANEVSKLRMLEELTRLVPDDSWLTEFNFQGDEKKIRLSGFAVTPAKLIPLLEDSPLFDDVKFSTVITTDRRSGKERFRIEMTIHEESEAGK